MAKDLPQIHVRMRDGGAAVFSVTTDTRSRRIELTEIATLNLRNGTVRPHGKRALTEPEIEAIRAWQAAREAGQAAREAADVDHTIEAINQLAHWAQTRATEAQLVAARDGLLMAMYDLRSVLIRRLSAQGDRQDGSA